MNKVLITLFSIVLFCGCLFAQFEGNALQFDGVNDYVNLGNSNIFNIDSAVTYEAWVMPDTNQIGFILDKWVSGFEDKFLIFDGSKVGFYLFNTFGGNALKPAMLLSR